MTDARLTVQVDGRDNLSGELKRIESKVIRFVGAVSSALTFAATVTFPIKESAEFQRELLNASKTTGFTAQQLAVLKDGLRSLSTQVNVTATDLAKIATLGGQIGIGQGEGPQAASELLEFTRVVAAAAVALDLSAEQVVVSFGKLINIFDIPQNQFENAISAINSVANEANALPQQLFDVLRRIGDLGGSVDLPDATALAATLLDLGLSSETAGTALTKFFADFKAKGAEFTSVVGSVASAQGLNISTTTEWIELVERDGVGALNLYLDALNEMTTADAAATKQQLTGAGRLFGAIDKLQTQRKREVDLRERAAKATERADRAEADGLGGVDVDNFRRQAAALLEAADNSSILAQRQATARKEFVRGTSVLEEQATALSGLIAQAQVFVNNIRNGLSGIGDVLLAPLTDAFRSLTESLRNPLVLEDIRQATRELLALFTLVRRGIDSVTSALGELGAFDFGRLVKVTGLIAFAAVFKGITGVVGLLGQSFLATIPGVRRLTGFLFGVSAAQKQATAEAQKTAQAQQRTGGFFTRIGRNAEAYVKTLARSSGVAARQTASTRAALVVEREKLSAANAAVAAVQRQSRVGKSLNTTAKLGVAIAEQRAKIEQAIASGASSRSIGGLRGRLTRLREQRAALFLANREARRLAENVGRLEAQSQRASTALRSMTIDGRLQAVADRLNARFTSMGAAVRSLASSTRALGAAGVATAGLQKLTASIVALNSAALRGITTAAGFGAAWSRAGTLFAKSSVLIASGAKLAARGLGLIAGAMSRIVGAAFFAVLIVDLLKMVGLWEKLKGGIRKALDVLGLSTPAFLESKAAMAEHRTEVGKLTAQYEELERAASAYTAVVSSRLASAFGEDNQLTTLGREELTFDPASPDSASARYTELVKDLQAQESRYQLALLQRRSALLRLHRLQDELATADHAAGEAREARLARIARLEAVAARAGRRGATVGAKNLAAARAEGLSAEEKRAAALRATLELVSAAYRDAVRQAEGFAGASARLDALNAAALNPRTQALLTTPDEEGVAPLQRLIELTARLRAARLAAAAAAEAQATAEKDVAGNPALSAFDREALLGRATGDVAAATADVASLEKAILAVKTALDKAGGSSDVVLASFLEFIVDGGDALSQATRARENYVEVLRNTKVEGLVQPLFSNESLLGAGEELVVAQRLQKGAEQAAAVMSEKASRYKNFVSQITREIENLVRDTAKFLTRLDANLERTRERAADFGLRQEEDRDLRGELAQLREQESKELAQARRRIRNKAALARAEFNIRERFRERELDAEQALEVQRAQRRLAAQKSRLAELQKQAAAIQKVIAEQNEIIGRTDLSPQAKSLAIEAKQKDIARLKATFDLIKKLGEEVSQTPNIGEVLVVDTADLAPFRAAITDAQSQIKALSLDQAGESERVFDSLATALQNAAQDAGESVRLLSAEFTQLAAQAGVSADATLRAVAQIVASTAAGIEAFRQVDTQVALGLTDPAAFLDLDISGFLQGHSDALRRELSGQEIDLAASVPVKTTGLAAAVERGLIDAVGEGLGGGLRKLRESSADVALIRAQLEVAPPTPDATAKFQGELRNLGEFFTVPMTGEVTRIQGPDGGFVETIKVPVAPDPASVPLTPEVAPVLPASTFTDMEQRIRDNVSPEIDAKLTITQVDGQVSLTGLFPKNARGGLLGDVQRFFAGGLASIAKFAAGGSAGRVRGPGGGTDDRIPALLSNGEFVIDALTTSRFGPRFFEYLQQAARGGVATNVIQGLGLPQFAFGGPVGASQALSFAGIATDFNSGGDTVKPRDTMDVVIRAGKDRATIQAERDQANSLVGILRNFERGRG